MSQKHKSGLSNPFAVFPEMNREYIASCIEHTLFKPDVNIRTILGGCADAKRYNFTNMCVSPYYVSTVVKELAGTKVKTCTVAGFSHAAASTKAKIAEINEAVNKDADEIDVSLMITAVKSGDYEAFESDLKQMVDCAKGRITVKAIYEQGLYTDEERLKVLSIIKNSGVQFVKISNALTGKAANKEDVKFVRLQVGEDIGIKIDGGIKTFDQAVEILSAGANRIGCSASVKIVE